MLKFVFRSIYYHLLLPIYPFLSVSFSNAFCSGQLLLSLLSVETYLPAKHSSALLLFIHFAQATHFLACLLSFHSYLLSPMMPSPAAPTNNVGRGERLLPNNALPPVADSVVTYYLRMYLRTRMVARLATYLLLL